MGPWPLNLTILAACFIVGGVPFGFIIGKCHGVDIREHGSGNIGATNVLRTCGKPAGLLCFFLDALKGFGPVFAVMTYTDATALSISAVSGTVCGHIWTPYLRFRGGKGIATSAGALLAIAWIPVVVGLVLWIIVVTATRYVSLGSILAALSLPITGLLIGRGLPGEPLSTPIIVLLSLLAGVAIARHHSNIKRLLAGTENKLGQAKDDQLKPEPEPESNS
ncbi:MAG: glycerol-3-phosphate 1-O-acyltransferase PlsY [Lentisphaeria bacterium]|jgi:glycerol-3-phosphate acyltransferase PlsY|nr:glycerol-3-phosphate 1-O-acyltransferase PlsY [Lentisphaeria bacterium]MDP7743164.1 glycerol-3-phosphate 1-O-acyltransferase PlsY [Lentisphaeria bacterium]